VKTTYGVPIVTDVHEAYQVSSISSLPHHKSIVFWALWVTSSNKAQKQSWRATKLVTLNLGLCIIVWAGGKSGRHYTNSSILMPTGKCTPSLIWVLGFMVKPLEFWAGCCSTVAMSPDFLLGPKLIEHILQMWQTDLLVAAAKTGRVINIKKGQFCASSVSLCP